MSLEDPFFMVREEVQKALKTSKGLYDRWCELLEVGGTGVSEEYDWTLNELRNSLRSIEWDLEDLEETVGIVEKNPRKFKIGPVEIQERRKFIDNARSSVKQMKDHIANPRVKVKDNSRERQSLLHANGQQQSRYQRLDNDIVESNQRFIDDMNQQQQVMIKTQDSHLENIGSSVGVLKDMSHRIHNELEEQSVMLDEFGHEMENTESKMDTTMKKIAKVLHMSNDRRQWCAIGILIVILIIIIILFATLP